MVSLKDSLLRLCLLVTASTKWTVALVPPQQQKSSRQQPPTTAVLSAAKDLPGMVAATVVSSAILFSISHPAPARAIDVVAGTALEAPIHQISEAAWPVVNALPDVAPLSSKFLGVVDKKIPGPKATEALTKGIEAFLAIPDDKITAFAATLQASYEGVSGDSCHAIPGTQSTAAQFASLVAVQAVDATQSQALATKFARANQAVPKTGGGDNCLPASEKDLEALWMGQTELTLNIPKAESKAFVGSLKTALSAVPPPEWLRLLPDVKKTVAGNVDVKTSVQLEKAGKALEKAFQEDARIQKRLSAN